MWSVGEGQGQRGRAFAREGVAAQGGIAGVQAPGRRDLPGVPGQDGTEERCVALLCFRR